MTGPRSYSLNPDIKGVIVHYSERQTALTAFHFSMPWKCEESEYFADLV